MQRIVYGGAKVSKTAEFSSEATRTGGENNVLKVRTEKYCQLWIPYSAKISFKNEGEILLQAHKS